MKQIEQNFLDSLIGMRFEEAIDLIKHNDLHYRIVCEDGNHFLITADLHLDRVNLHIENGIIESCYIG